MKGCFICPIHDRGGDFKYGYALVESAIKYCGIENLYFVFSNISQKEKFLRHCEKSFGCVPGALVYEEDLSDSRNPVSIKKYYAVKQLKDQYDYLAAIDCECLFIRETDPGELMHDIYVSGSYLACNLATTAANDLRICAQQLGLDEDPVLIKETRGFTCTWWFNEIPIYSSENLNDFFDWLEQDDRYKKVYYNWHCFDYLVYVIWLLIFKQKHLKIYEYRSTVGIIESLWCKEVVHKFEIERNLGTHWSSRRTGEPYNDNICMLFHLDRKKRPLRSVVLKVLRKPIRKVKKLLRRGS